ncbi:type II toxin-antitoxin system RelE/ParE family toxin (plasmid) [Deinococcus radiomollis]|uniref:type II toxin-antitoxin system RelE family toxin n=1 Tax=Deinococcus radiomollis TaxID=468916 RepID=UPI00389284C2
MNDFEVKFEEAAEQDLAVISDQSTVEAIIRRTLELKQEPMKQGKALKGVLKDYRSVRAAGQRYRIVYQVAVEAGRVVIAVIGIRKAKDKKDVYAVAEKRLGS